MVEQTSKDEPPMETEAKTPSGEENFSLRGSIDVELAPNRTVIATQQLSHADADKQAMAKTFQTPCLVAPHQQSLSTNGTTPIYVGTKNSLFDFSHSQSISSSLDAASSTLMPIFDANVNTTRAGSIPEDSKTIPVAAGAAMKSSLFSKTAFEPTPIPRQVVEWDFGGYKTVLGSNLTVFNAIHRNQPGLVN